jgi:hypothetical protein
MTNSSYSTLNCSLANIDACQHIVDRTVIFQLADSAGFASEINNLIRTFLYAIRTRRKFIIDDRKWNYGSFTSLFNISHEYDTSWHLSMLRQCQIRTLSKHDRNQSNHVTITRDRNGGFSTLNLLMTSYENTDRILEIKRHVAHYLWQTMNNRTRRLIEQYINEISLNTIDYAMHIRRGDKLRQESNKTSIEQYIHAVEQLMNQQGKISKHSI